MIVFMIFTQIYINLLTQTYQINKFNKCNQEILIQDYRNIFRLNPLLKEIQDITMLLKLFSHKIKAMCYAESL